MNNDVLEWLITFKVSNHISNLSRDIAITKVNITTIPDINPVKKVMATSLSNKEKLLKAYQEFLSAYCGKELQIDYAFDRDCIIITLGALRPVYLPLSKLDELRNTIKPIFPLVIRIES